MIGRELYFIDKYRMPTYMKDQFESLRSSEDVILDMRIQGVPSYRPLDNLAYRNKFMFEPPRYDGKGLHRSTEKLIYQYDAKGDLVSDPQQGDVAFLALMMPYVT